MSKKFPGTTAEANSVNKETADATLTSLFAFGGLYRSQVCMLTGIEPYTIQNWVRRGFVASPDGKKYTRRQFCRLVIINMLKDCMLISDITDMLSYINGILCDEGDDIIADDLLYLYFVDLLSKATDGKGAGDRENIEAIADSILSEYGDTDNEGKNKIKKVLCLMYFAYRSSQFKNSADSVLDEIKEAEKSDN